MQAINGVLILDKPEGISSNRALQRAKRIFSAKKAGHTGTLDLLASGVLPLCFGEATKFSQCVLNANKSYRVSAELGKRTTTCDREGEITETKPVHVTRDQLLQTLDTFLGETQQIPSMFSALKHKGQPLYKLARKGISVLREPRTITITEIKLLDWHDSSFTLDVHCGKGTYIRNLIDDIGQALNCGAYVSSLRRLSAGPFSADQMLTLDKLETIKEQQGLDALKSRLLPISSLIVGIPQLNVTEEQATRLQHGQKIPPKEHEATEQGVFNLCCGSRFLGLACVDEHCILKAKRMLSSQD
jgi:tRNA pseudouridine55 synthase